MPDDSINTPVQKTSKVARLAGASEGSHQTLAAIFVGVLVVVFVVILVMHNRENIFTLHVSTEVAAFTVTDPILSEWSLSNARLIVDPFSPDESGRDLPEAVLDINPQTQVRVQRHGVDLARIELRRNDNAPIGVIITDSGEQIALRDWALVLLKVVERPLVLPFRGKLIAGDDVAVGVDSILLGGTVTVVEEQLLGNMHYVAGQEALDPGDRVQFWLHDSDGDGGTVAATVSGFLRAEAMEGFSEPVNAFTLVAHGQADYVQVERLGSAGYHIRAHQFARFLHDPLLAAATAIVALVVLLIELLSKGGVFLKSRGLQSSLETGDDTLMAPSEEHSGQELPMEGGRKSSPTDHIGDRP